MERVKSEDFIDWVHRRLAEGDSNSDLRPSKPSDPLAPSDPSDSSNSSPAVYTISPTTNFVLRCSQNGPSEPFLSTTQAARLNISSSLGKGCQLAPTTRKSLGRFVFAFVAVQWRLFANNRCVPDFSSRSEAPRPGDSAFRCVVRRRSSKGSGLAGHPDLGNGR